MLSCCQCVRSGGSYLCVPRVVLRCTKVCYGDRRRQTAAFRSQFGGGVHIAHHGNHASLVKLSGGHEDPHNSQAWDRLDVNEKFVKRATGVRYRVAVPVYAPNATMTSLSTYVEQLRALGNNTETGVYSLPIGMRA